jgi:hypothetical protein
MLNPALNRAGKLRVTGDHPDTGRGPLSGSADPAVSSDQKRVPIRARVLGPRLSLNEDVASASRAEHRTGRWPTCPTIRATSTSATATQLAVAGY